MSRPRVPAPPEPFPAVAVQPIPAGTSLHRCHAGTLRPAAFNPCLGQPSRFAPFTDRHGTCVPTLYAAETAEAAAFETIFHDIAPTARFKTVRLQAIEARSMSEIAPRRDLRLVKLFAPDLKAWTVARNRLIDTPRSTYAQTVQWARAIHAAHPGVDGLIWTSRQCDPAWCTVLFGDRVTEEDFDEVRSRRAAADPGLILELRGYGQRAGITIVS